MSVLSAASELTQREAQVAEQERQLREILEYCPAGLSIVDDEGRLLFHNWRLRELLGYESEELELFDTKRFWHDLDHRARIVERLRERGGQLLNEEVIWRTKEGQRAALSAKLAKYLAPQVYDSIFAGRQDVKIESKRKKLTICFSDLVGFTEMTDKMESEDLTQLLNHYLTEMSRIALQYGATVDKYMGDAIVMFFGDPETRGVKEDALACVEMALAMQKRMHELAEV
jgi:PAS domain S-box-containing protein